MATDTGNDSFSASEEAFFQSLPPPDPDATSLRPVTLEEEESFVTEPVRSRELEARRARFMRPVAMTLAALGALTLVGLTRRALTPTPAELALAAAPLAPAPALERATAPSDSHVAPVTTTSEATNAVTLPQQIIIDAETEDPPALDMSPGEPAMSTATSSAAPGATTSSQSQSIEEAPPVAAPVSAPATAPSTDAKSTAARPARPGSSAAWAGGIGKAGLLSAIRASRPARGDARKTL